LGKKRLLEKNKEEKPKGGAKGPIVDVGLTMMGKTKRGNYLMERIRIGKDLCRGAKFFEVRGTKKLRKKGPRERRNGKSFCRGKMRYWPWGVQGRRKISHQ